MTTPFQEKVYAALRKVPKGKVTTYALLGKAVGCGSAQAIGQAMRCNPYAPQVPCHRVVASGGNIGGFMGERSGKAIAKKIALLKREGVRMEKRKVIGFEKSCFRF